MNSVKRQELGNELQSSQHLRLQSASYKLLDIATVPAGDPEVQRKKPIATIRADCIMRSHLGLLQGLRAMIVDSRVAAA